MIHRDETRTRYGLVGIYFNDADSTAMVGVLPGWAESYRAEFVAALCREWSGQKVRVPESLRDMTHSLVRLVLDKAAEVGPCEHESHVLTEPHANTFWCPECGALKSLKGDWRMPKL
jgi:hypothetical protein